MLDGGRIVGGLALLVVVAASPLWLRSVRGAKPADVAKPATGKPCILPAQDMRKRHPALLAEWREQVVRQGMRDSLDGKATPRSLTGTCLGCHGQASAFCDKCHAQTAVALSCWGCHANVPRALAQLPVTPSERRFE
jgi:hypothetical protein